MAVSVDHSQAQQILLEAFQQVQIPAFQPSSPYRDEIADVVLGTHLTYRYILLTNLLAKAVNSYVHPLALQAGAGHKGAFDARSLCHKVLVPFERQYLGGKLGRSNEPFLNKPARFTDLSSSNAVRRGYDTEILNKSIHILTNTKTSDEGRQALIDALFFTMQRDSLIAEVASIEGDDATLHAVLHTFGRTLLSKSIEGETSAILAGLTFAIQARINNISLDIHVHPVNQAGSSSNEILDIDVYSNGMIYQTAEVKDKYFTYEDVDHAANKVKSAGYNGFLFIFGPQANTSTQTLDEFTQKIAKDNIRVSFSSVFDFYSMTLGYCPSDVDAEFVWQSVEKIMKAARVKDLTKQHVFSSAKSAGLIA